MFLSHTPTELAVDDMSWYQTISTVDFVRFELLFKGFSYGTLTVYSDGSAKAFMLIAGSRKGRAEFVERWMIDRCVAWNLEGTKPTLVH